MQADEIRVKIQGGVVWLALAMMVSTRLWLAGALSPSRDFDLVSAVAQQVRQCALCRPLLLCVDGFSAYVRAFRAAFRTPGPTKHRGRPRLVAWPDIYIGQVIKHRVGCPVMQITRRIVQGAAAHVQRVLAASQGDGVLNVAYIERLNATFRQRLAALSRRGRALVRGPVPLQASMYLMGTVYNFCTFHKSLRVALWLPGNRKHWVPRTPVMAAGISDHRWTVRELLTFRVPLPPWVAPKRRGRPPKSPQQAVDPPKRRGRPPKPHSQAVKI